MQLRTIDEMILSNTIVMMKSGSHAYGMSTPTSDLDIRGIFVADPVNLLTPFFPVSQKINTTDGNDIVIYELNKFMELMIANNPNIIELLWIDESDILTSTPVYEMVRSYRHALLSSKLAFTFTGYASAQIKRIKSHNKWISNPKPELPPVQVDYVTMVHNFTNAKIFNIKLRDYQTGYRLIPYDGNVMGLYRFDGYQSFSDDGSLNLVYDKEDKSLFLNDDGTRKTPEFIVKYNRDQYNHDLEDWNNYWHWKRNRNVTRSALEEQYSFDTKHGMHCVRLLRMGVEALKTGTIQVKRPDAEELLSIRNGAWTYEYMLEYAEHMDNEIRNVLYPKTALPKTPNIKLAAKVLMEAQEMLWNK